MLDTLVDGFYAIHIKGGLQMVVKASEGNLYSTNLDCVDPDGWVAKLNIKYDEAALVEPLSEQRYHYMRELALRRRKINEITTALQLNQLVVQAKQQGLIQEQPEEETRQPLKFMPKNGDNIATPLQQAPPITQKLRMKDETYDGTIIDLPSIK